MVARGRSPPEIMIVARTLAMLAFFVNVIKTTTGECPRVCECKWKSGKESVLCANANMTEVPRSLDSGTQLLDLTGNRLGVIGKDEFFNASLLNLQKVFMSRCRLRSLHRSAFRNIINLVELDLSYNELETIPSHTFQFITELRELKLNGNPIIRVVNYSFKTVPHLTKLDLSECEIMSVEARAFQGVESSLEWLKLDNNYMTSVAPLALTPLGNLHGLELSGNPWNCTCRLRPLRQWMLRHNVPHGISPTCRNPSRLSGRSWDKLDVDEFACAPRIEAALTPRHSDEGSNVTLSCSLDGTPEPAVLWLRKNQVIANLSLAGKASKLYVVRVSDRIANLTITEADAKDNGEYVCRAENKAGRAEASVTLAVSARAPDRSWSARTIVAVAVVVALFLVFAALLVACACGSRRRKYPYRQPAVAQSRLDSYEMNSKKTSTVGYDKIIKKESSYGAGDGADFSLVQGMQSKGGNGSSYKVIGGGESDANEEESSSACGGEGAIAARERRGPWNAEKSSDGEEPWGEALAGEMRPSPDLHIPRMKRSERERRQGEGMTDGDGRPSDFLVPGAASHILHKQRATESGGTVYTTETSSSPSPSKFPDLLELSANNNNNNNFSTLPRIGSYKVKRGRCSSESQSPLLPGSSGDSCDSGFSVNRRLSVESALPKNASLPTSPRNRTPTPLLDFLEHSPSAFRDASPTNFQYKSSELEKFLKEYRNLQEQLYKMKESCENLREDNLKFGEASRSVEGNTISRLVDPAYGSPGRAIEPLYGVTRHLLGDAAGLDSVYNGNKLLLEEEEDNNNPKSVLDASDSEKTLIDGLALKSDPYWLSRQKILTTLAEAAPGDRYYES